MPSGTFAKVREFGAGEEPPEAGFALIARIAFLDERISCEGSAPRSRGRALVTSVQ